jgi:hypothetical protein
MNQNLLTEGQAIGLGLLECDRDVYERLDQACYIVLNKFAVHA